MLRHLRARPIVQPLGGVFVDGSHWVASALAFLIGYGLGAIPFGVLVMRAAGAGDLRVIGSGNIGATNVLRTGRRGLAAATLLLDAAKGAAAVLLTGALWPDPGVSGQVVLPAAAGAFLGHLYPVWLGFRGGKGVATMLGLALALHWPSGLAFALVWAGALALTRYSSVGGLSAAAATPVAAAVAGRFQLALVFLPMALLVLWKHRANVERLLAGTEPRVGQGGRSGSGAGGPTLG